jgi:hypothetical protein
LPRNLESRELGIALRMIKKTYPQIEWVISFADGCQCGDGTICRAAGFVLTAIRKNHSLLRAPDDLVEQVSIAQAPTSRRGGGQLRCAIMLPSLTLLDLQGA